MPQVINLCSEDESQPNLSDNPQTKCDAIVDQSAGRNVKFEEIDEEVLEDGSVLANGRAAKQQSGHDKGQRKRNNNKKRKREEARQQVSCRQQEFSGDEKVKECRTKITEAQRDVQRCRDELNNATNRLTNLQQQLTHRLKLLRRRADENFNWLGEFPWHDRLRHQLNHVFRLISFRPFQHEALNATLLKRDVFAILPTGAGKSLIYQLAAVVDGGLTLVITPLLSLSMDQRMALSRLNIRAESIDSITDKNKVKKIYNELLPNRGMVPGSKHPRKRRMRGHEWIQDDMNPAILFVTPEQIAKSKRLMGRLEGMHENGHLSRICIDEAHCCSLWGHDFRSEYRKLGILRRQLPDTPILALTATCSQETTEDVCKMLETRDCVIFRGSIDRPNLFYEVREKGADDAAVLHDILGLLQGEFANMCGIVYVLAKKEATYYAEFLQEAGIKAGYYHGDLEREERNTVHAAWSDGRVQIVVATIAFGLGIDNPRVRFVIHATMAKSLEGYYQESGRAGRDGKHAKCVLLHRAKEFPRMSGFVADKGSDGLRKMYEMYSYAASRGLQTLCRRAAIAQAFGEKPPERKDKANCCDVCAARISNSYGRVIVDVTDLARSVGRIVLRGAMERPDEKVTLLAVALNWGNTGAKGKRMRGEEKAVARGICVDTRLEILAELVLTGVLEEYHRHSSFSVNAYVTAGERTDQVFDGDRIKIAVTKEKAMELVKAGYQIVGGVGNWQNTRKNEVVKEEVLDGGNAGDEDIYDQKSHPKVKDHEDLNHEESGGEFDSEERDKEYTKDEQVDIDENIKIGAKVEHNDVDRLYDDDGQPQDGRQHVSGNEDLNSDAEVDHDDVDYEYDGDIQENDNIQSDEEVFVRRKRIRM